MKAKFIATALIVAIPAFLLGRVIWPDPANALAPSNIQLPFLLILSVIEALLFGSGIAFLVYGWPLVQRATQNRTWNMVIFFAIVWSLICWWPHDNMHRANGEDVWGLIRIEYIFHFTLYIVAVLLAVYFWKLMTSINPKKPA